MNVSPRQTGPLAHRRRADWLRWLMSMWATCRALAAITSIVRGWSSADDGDGPPIKAPATSAGPVIAVIARFVRVILMGVSFVGLAPGCGLRLPGGHGRVVGRAPDL